MSKSQRTQKWVSLVLAIVMVASFLQPFSVAMGSELGTEPQALGSENATEVAEPLSGDNPLARGVVAAGPVEYGRGDDHDDDDDDEGTLTIYKVLKDHSGATLHSSQYFSMIVSGPHGYHKSVTVQAGSSRKVEDLNYGTYTVTEQGASDYTVAVSGTATFDRHNNRRSITVTNTEKALGELTVCKTVKDANGKTISTPRSFTFTLTGPSYPSGKEMTITSGTPLVIGGLIYGDYTVSEHNSDYSTVVSRSQCLSIRDKSGQITITNTELPLGQLTITKVVKDAKGTIINTPRVFHITLTGPSYPEGSAPMTLTSGTPLVVGDLIYGTYAITEQDGAGYSVAVAGDTILNIVDKAGVIMLTNTELTLGELDLRVRVYNALGQPVAPGMHVAAMAYGPSFPAGKPVDLTTGETLVLDHLMFGTYRVAAVPMDGYTLSIGDPVTLSLDHEVDAIELVERTPLGAASVKPIKVIAGTPKTGDTNSSVAWIGLVLLGLATIAVFSRKKEDEIS